MIHSIKPSYAVKVVHSRVHLLIADIFSETNQNTVKTLQNHLWIVDTYIVDVVHKWQGVLYLVDTRQDLMPFLQRKSIGLEKLFFSSYIILTILFADFSVQDTALLSPVFNRKLNSISRTTTHSFTNNHPWCATVR